MAAGEKRSLNSTDWSAPPPRPACQGVHARRVGAAEALPSDQERVAHGDPPDYLGSRPGRLMARLPNVEDVTCRLPSPDHFESRVRGKELTARVGTLLGIASGICFLTGRRSHFQYDTPDRVPLGLHPT